MKKIFASFGWILLLIPLISVASVRTALAIKPSGNADIRDVSGFTSLSSGGSFRVHVKFGQKESVRLEGEDDILDEIETVVENGTLKIRTKKPPGGSFWRNGLSINVGRIDIYVTAIKLNSITLSGSGNIDIEDTLKGDRLQTTVSGSGNISGSISTNSYSANISGSGVIDISGSAKSADIQISGSGNFRGMELKTDETNIKISGSGNANVNVDSSLNAAVSGSGSVRYSGNVKMVNTMKSGSGRISRL